MGGKTGSPANVVNVVLETRLSIVVRIVSLNAIDKNAIVSENRKRRNFIWIEGLFYRECKGGKKKNVRLND